jgi:hypothetical protein
MLMTIRNSCVRDPLLVQPKKVVVVRHYDATLQRGKVDVSKIFGATQTGVRRWS